MSDPQREFLEVLYEGHDCPIASLEVREDGVAILRSPATPGYARVFDPASEAPRYLAWYGCLSHCSIVLSRRLPGDMRETVTLRPDWGTA